MQKEMDGGRGEVATAKRRWRGPGSRERAPSGRRGQGPAPPGSEPRAHTAGGGAGWPYRPPRTGKGAGLRDGGGCTGLPRSTGRRVSGHSESCWLSARPRVSVPLGPAAGSPDGRTGVQAQGPWGQWGGTSLPTAGSLREWEAPELRPHQAAGPVPDQRRGPGVLGTLREVRAQPRASPTGVS